MNPLPEGDSSIIPPNIKQKAQDLAFFQSFYSAVKARMYLIYFRDPFLVGWGINDTVKKNIIADLKSTQTPRAERAATYVAKLFQLIITRMSHAARDCLSVLLYNDVHNVLQLYGSRDKTSAIVLDIHRVMQSPLLLFVVFDRKCVCGTGRLCGTKR